MEAPGCGTGSGSGSGFNKKGREGLPPTARRSSRRRDRDENSNEENPENPNLQTQPQQADEVSGQMETPAEQRARLANRRYLEAFRHRRQTRVQQLETQVANLEAKNAQGNIEYERQTTEWFINQNEMEALRIWREAAKANLLAREAETRKLKGKIESLERTIEADDKDMENIIMDDPFYRFFDEMFTSVIHAVTPPYPGNPPPPPPPQGGGDEPGSSGVNDSSSSAQSV